VTDRKRADEYELRIRKLEALGTLSGGIAHEFNNILFAISGNARIAIADLQPAHSARISLDEIEKASRRAKELVQRMLAFSRPEEPRRQPVDLAPVLESVLREVRASMFPKIRIRARIDPATPPVEADAAQLNQLIVNLMTNADQAIGTRSGTIDVALAPLRIAPEPATSAPAGLLPGHYALLTVGDDGCGMTMEIQARIFDPFFTTKPVDVGTGLGLSVVHGIVQSHGGVIVVQSEPGTGSVFRVYLPAATAAFAAQAAAAPAAESPPGGRILYVDDEEPLVYLAERMLRRRGYDVVGCTSPHDGLARFAEAPGAFDVVVTDIAMPGMTGFEFAGAILALRADIPVVMTSGHTRPEDHAEATRIGVEALVLKPNTVDELCDVIDGIARRAASDRGPRT
jgi:nitrogen-specific signal transduction histidine kinase/CheY-like chemotaxis protein